MKWVFPGSKRLLCACVYSSERGDWFFSASAKHLKGWADLLVLGRSTNSGKKGSLYVYPARCPSPATLFRPTCLICGHRSDSLNYKYLYFPAGPLFLFFVSVQQREQTKKSLDRERNERGVAPKEATGRGSYTEDTPDTRRGHGLWQSRPATLLASSPTHLKFLAGISQVVPDSNEQAAIAIAGTATGRGRWWASTACVLLAWDGRVSSRGRGLPASASAAGRWCLLQGLLVPAVARGCPRKSPLASWHFAAAAETKHVRLSVPSALSGAVNPTRLFFCRRLRRAACRRATRVLWWHKSRGGVGERGGVPRSSAPPAFCPWGEFAAEFAQLWAGQRGSEGGCRHGRWGDFP